jgi:hypothetical protein
MSLKSFIAQVEANQQVSEAVATAPTIGTTTSTATAPQQGQKVIVKPGQPQQQSIQPQATITNQAGKVIAQADAANAKKLGDLVNMGDITMMDPLTGKPLEEEQVDETSPEGWEGTVKAMKKHKEIDNPWALTNSMKNKGFKSHVKESTQFDESVMTASKLDAILSNYPHEHKMAQEGWGMDASLIDALTDHYHAEGRIPRSIWTGPSEELRKHVEECYAQDTQLVTEHDELDAQHDEWKQAVAQAHPGVQGIRTVSKPDTQELSAQVKGQDRSYGTFNTDTGQGQVLPEDTLEEVSELEKRLKQPTEESTMYESKKLKGGQAKLDANKNGKLEKSDFEALRAKKVEEATEKTKTGIKHTADAGGYGRKHEDDEDEDGKKVKSDAPKKGRGRPKKGGDETGEVKKYNFDALSSFGGGKKPKKEIGKVSKKHKIATKADREKFDESISKWDAQLKSLLEGKQLNEGLSVSTSVGQEGAPDSVSITANDEDAHQLLALLNNAGMGTGVPGHSVKSNPVEELLKAHGASQEGGSFSTAGTEEPGDVEVTDFDGAQEELSGNEDDGMDAMKKMLAAMGIGSDAAPEPKHNEFDAGSDSEEATDGEESGEEEKEAVVDEEWSEDKADEDYDDDGEVESEKEEHEGAVANAIDDSEESEESEESDDETEEKVEESVETQCNECGAMYEGGSHTCSHGDEEQLNEWANSPQGQSEDEDFTATIEYFTKAISGGLNGQKRDQTVMPGTKVTVSEGYTIDVAEEMRKLAGIK